MRTHFAGLPHSAPVLLIGAGILPGKITLKTGAQRHREVITVGMGPGGEAAAGRLLDAGRRVAVVERELIGGECAYWACIPSKTLLRAGEARAEAAGAAGVATPVLNWPELRDYRDYMVRHLDDAAQVSDYEEAGATVVKGAARLAGPHRVEAGGELLEADHIIIATGSEPVRPDIDGLDQVTVWTNREATTVADIPGRVVLIGGSAVGLELGLFYARMGAQVTIVQRAATLVDREDPRVGELARDALAAEGVTIHTGRTATRARPASGAGAVITLDDGTQAETDVEILTDSAVGRIEADTESRPLAMWSLPAGASAAARDRATLFDNSGMERCAPGLGDDERGHGRPLAAGEQHAMPCRRARPERRACGALGHRRITARRDAGRLPGARALERSQLGRHGAVRQQQPLYRPGRSLPDP